MDEMGVLRLDNDAVMWRQIDGEVIALGIEKSTYFSTNASGTVLWQRLLDGATREQLVDALTETYAIDRGQAGSDVDAFLARLNTAGFLL